MNEQILFIFFLIIFLFAATVPLIHLFEIKKDKKTIEKLILDIMGSSSKPLHDVWEAKKNPFFVKTIVYNQATIELLEEIKKNVDVK